jgi:hypothetical protein
MIAGRDDLPQGIGKVPSEETHSPKQINPNRAHRSKPNLQPRDDGQALPSTPPNDLCQ